MADEGYGLFITKEQMQKDGILPYNQCTNVFMKCDPSFLSAKFYKMAVDAEFTAAMYTNNFNKSVESSVKKMIKKYHPHKEYMFMSEDEEDPGKRNL